MKLRKLEGIIKKSDEVRLYSQRRRQWLGDENCLFPLDGVPFLESEDILCTLLDIPEAKQEKLAFDIAEMPDKLCMTDTYPGEVILEPGRCPYCLPGNGCAP